MPGTQTLLAGLYCQSYWRATGKISTGSYTVRLEACCHRWLVSGCYGHLKEARVLLLYV